MGTEASVLSNDFHSRLGRVVEVVPSGSLPLKMAFLYTLKTCPQIWTVSWGNLLESCDWTLLLFILSLFLFQVCFFFFSFSLVPIIVYGCGYMDQLV
jgi:hypothetical protein